MNFLPVVIRVIDSHTGGMPTRLVVAGGPDLPGSTMHDRLADFQTRHDAWRRALTGAPRSAPGTIGAVLTEPERPASLAGLLLFDANGPLERHPGATVGVIASLAHLGRLRPGPVQLDLPAGPVEATFLLDGGVRLAGEPETARAHILFDGTMVVEADDPYGWGLPPA
jgi:4-hydroxyproline epimerase